MFDISPTEEVGDFEVKAKFMGVEMEKVQLHFQVNISCHFTRMTRKYSSSHDSAALYTADSFPSPMKTLPALIPLQMNTSV